MKIYFVVNEPSERTLNHFVSSLGNALVKQGCEVVYGLRRLWTDKVMECDIVHFQWPEFIFGSQKQNLLEDDVVCLEHRLGQLKERGIRLFVQVHNLRPHTIKNRGVLRLYDVVYSHADIIVHLGQCSCDLLHSQYPNARHVVIPHHIYDNMLSFSISRQDARKRLHLPEDKAVVLSFGKFRNEKERHFVLFLRHHFAFSVLFLTPGFYRETLHTWNPRKLIRRLYRTIRYRMAGIHFCNEVISDDLMQCYFCAADVVLIQRLDILNSGNLPMAFAAGKVVVGPDVGNVGQILRETGNFTFDPQHLESAVDALQKALRSTLIGEQNKAYASVHWSSDIIAVQLLRYYQHIKYENHENS